MDEIVREFLLESQEFLDQLDRDLVRLEQSPGSPELVASVFRTVHSLKGTSGLLGFVRLQDLAHAGEGLLVGFREGRAALTPTSTAVLLRMVDRVRELLAQIARDGTEGGVEVGDVVQEVNALLEEQHACTTEAEASSPTVTTRVDLPEASVRVGIDVLDELTVLVEELALLRDEVRAIGGSPHASGRLAEVGHRLDRVTDALHDGVMRTRRQPIGHLWARLPRVVRDLGAQAGKQVRVRAEGRETSLDRDLLDAVKDPLTHLVRNAVDHGLEGPEARLAAGKPATGTVTVRAGHCGEGCGVHVVLEVCDDGTGIDADRVAAAALRHGLRTGPELGAMSYAEKLRLVLLPGLSTAGSVTHLSGRGVGMDVVRANVEALGGSVEIESEPGRGTTCRLRIPETRESGLVAGAQRLGEGTHGVLARRRG
jgi:two-component system chemotaxis sensor kinase CheA